eukprot:TRINITY_DN1692_c0_g5_i1.p1 TRINITY_DN1692_c0_g5~~TRINITY_DN1692_c0_g5_i1.p1  ORF type:complete len:1035 (+),score=105.37 TRINITY_DN1692_c0_g5_i1:70-3174(+)
MLLLTIAVSTLLNDPDNYWGAYSPFDDGGSFAHSGELEDLRFFCSDGTIEYNDHGINGTFGTYPRGGWPGHTTYTCLNKQDYADKPQLCFPVTTTESVYYVATGHYPTSIACDGRTFPGNWATHFVVSDTQFVRWAIGTSTSVFPNGKLGAFSTDHNITIFNGKAIYLPYVNFMQANNDTNTIIFSGGHLFGTIDITDIDNPLFSPVIGSNSDAGFIEKAYLTKQGELSETVYFIVNLTNSKVVKKYLPYTGSTENIEIPYLMWGDYPVDIGTDDIGNLILLTKEKFYYRIPDYWTWLDGILKGPGDRAGLSSIYRDRIIFFDDAETSHYVVVNLDENRKFDTFYSYFAVDFLSIGALRFVLEDRRLGITLLSSDDYRGVRPLRLPDEWKETMVPATDAPATPSPETWPPGTLTPPAVTAGPEVISGNSELPYSLEGPAGGFKEMCVTLGVTGVNDPYFYIVVAGSAGVRVFRSYNGWGTQQMKFGINLHASIYGDSISIAPLACHDTQPVFYTVVNGTAGTYRVTDTGVQQFGSGFGNAYGFTSYSYNAEAQNMSFIDRDRSYIGLMFTQRRFDVGNGFMNITQNGVPLLARCAPGMLAVLSKLDTGILDLYTNNWDPMVMPAKSISYESLDIDGLNVTDILIFANKVAILSKDGSVRFHGEPPATLDPGTVGYKLYENRRSLYRILHNSDGTSSVAYNDIFLDNTLSFRNTKIRDVPELIFDFKIHAGLIFSLTESALLVRGNYHLDPAPQAPSTPLPDYPRYPGKSALGAEEVIDQTMEPTMEQTIEVTPPPPEMSPEPTKAPEVSLYGFPAVLMHEQDCKTGVWRRKNLKKLDKMMHGMQAWPAYKESTFVDIPVYFQRTEMHGFVPEEDVRADTNVSFHCPMKTPWSQVQFWPKQCYAHVFVAEKESCYQVTDNIGQLLVQEGWTEADCGPMFRVSPFGSTHNMRVYRKLLRRGSEQPVFFTTPSNTATRFIGFGINEVASDCTMLTSALSCRQTDCLWSNNTCVEKPFCSYSCPLSDFLSVTTPGPSL